ncbi:amino acid adenylation domain-containing protein [Nostoc sp. KVJ3]|uniref:non-ribosomal peptide synthetase n=1 Tax=Nostoc sp. KVJ3 TaxID=457945 RepID=UPI002237B5FA|nr:non-ribosomal peptide synthetase [Nostoc sp. KVJ3]MCW5312699.1 amino acid adenylation domain-containing protein [Nostoc sp. KVJ3]
MLEEMQGFRLSPQQKHLWQLQEIDNLPYRSQCAILIEGDLDVNILKLVLEKIINRYEILRTNFHSLAGMTIPLQVIGKQKISLDRVYDLSSLTSQEQEDSLTALFHQVSQQPFDLVQDSPLQLSLVTLAASKYVLILSLPALCADNATLKILVQEISQSYADWLQGEELDNEPLQYADLAEWQNELLEGAETEAGRDYWQKQDISLNLQGLKLPFEKQKIDELIFKPQMQSFAIAPELIKQIDILTQYQDTSKSEFLLACWQVLIWRLAKQDNLTIGMAFAGRKYQELDTVIGLCAKILPLRINIEIESKIQDFIYKNKEIIQQLDKIQDYFNWEQIAGLIPNTLRFFPLCFEFEEQPAKYVAADVSFTIYQQYTCIERFKLKLSCLHQDDALTAALHYDSSVFQAEDIKRLIEQFQTLIASAIANPDATISELEVLGQIERQQLLCEVNNNQRDYPQTKCIHQLFEEQAQKTPDKIAVVFENEQLTYAQLNRKVNQLAHYLQQQGVKAEVVVGLCIERSLEMIIGLLGILKAGGAYLPLDPTLPQGSLDLRLQKIHADIILTQQCWLNILPTDAARVICLDTDWEVIAQNKDENPICTATLENLVYVLFTSGSTGKPKGVAIAHQQLLNYVNAIIDRLNLPAGINFATVSTLAADLGNTVIFPALCTGGCLHLISYQRATDSAALAEYCQKHPIDCLKIVPSHLASLLASSWAKLILPNQRLILGGEVASWQLIEQIQEYAPDCLIFNHYGPTEACVGVCTLEIVPGQVERHLAATVPLGRSIANTQVYILEEHHKLAPIGVKGEIYIGGAGLARCYLNQPDQTALKFIPHLYSDIPGARLYKTGDLGRYLPNGTIEFLGRIDNQVKIRGFRIELGEIEAVLNQHSNVQEVVVLARESESGQKYLVAFVVPSEESPCFINELRGYVREQLPEYMLPSAFVILKALPLTSNGKVDRQALRELNPVRPELETSLATPRTPVEEVLAGIWIGLLGIERVGIHNNFFDLGGHSLLATQVVSQVREAFQVEMRLRSLFETPTIAGLAELIETAMRRGQNSATTLINQVKREGELPLSFAQQRLWFLNQMEPGNPFYNISRSVLLKGSLNVAALEQSINEIVRRHEVLRTSFTDVDGQPVQKIASALNIKLPIIDLGELSQEEREVEVRRLASSQARQSFDLTQDALLRTSLLRLEEEEHILVFTIHHIVADGWSAGVIVREVAALYKSFSGDKPSSLPNLTIQYADFAIWQRQWLQTEIQLSQMAYWKQQLGGNLPILQLPTDRPRPAIQTFRGRKQSWQISKVLTEALKSFSRREAVTLFMTLLAAFKTLLYRYTNQADILIGSPIANRNRSEIEPLIGFFVNTLVLRTDLSENPSFKELLRRVREVTLDAYAHQDLPFEQLVEELQPQRNLSHTPLFQVMLILQNAPMEVLKLPGVILSPMEVETETAMFDITVFLTETEQGLMSVFEYNSDLFDAATINRMQGHFQILLEGIVANPDRCLSDLPILTATEQQQLLVDWNQTSADYPSSCIHQLFETQVEQTPNSIAVVFEDQQLTYQELNVRANQLAQYLQGLGVVPEVLVGICVERSLDMVVGLLGILKAGGAYVPLDPAYPHERLAFMLEDAQVSVLLTQQKLMEILPKHQAKVVYLDTDWQKIVQQSNCHPISQVTTKDLAYVIYTSGSTGKPKGVQVPHRALVNFLSAMRLNIRLTQEDILLSVTTLSFDIAALEIYLPLIVGARLIVVSREVAVDGTQLLERLISSGITVIQATPATWRLLLAAGWRGRWSLKVLCGGEALDRELANQLLERTTELWNLYGPTETTIWSAAHQVEATNNVEGRDGIISIGRPIANTEFYILDENLHPVPVGVPGELHIGGLGLALGYLNQPELTVQKFIPNPFNNASTSRLYKTGDLVRYRLDGTLEYLGRIDHQVKVRGFRIELGEIETLLSQNPEVQQAVVLVQESQPDNKRLIAYIVPNLQSQNLDELGAGTPSYDEQISQWKSVWDENYSQSSPDQEPTLNLLGWNSSYTGQPIPTQQMHEWVEHTVERILNFKPTRVLEIGCGTGLLLFRIASHCTQYWGTDFSQSVIDYIQQQLRLQAQPLTQVTLCQREADNFQGFEAEAFNAVILNSVVQYFPNINYLLQVLEGAVASVEPGGFIFVGDVRSLPLLEAFHASVQLYQAPALLSKTQLRQRVKQSLEKEQELVIDPAFFIALKQHLPQISHVRIYPKRGHHHNELTKFRYDVILHIQAEVDSAKEFPWLDWQEQELTLTSIRQLLQLTKPDMLGLRRVPNARLLAEIKTLELLASDSLTETVEDIRQALRSVVTGSQVNPEDLWALNQELPYTIDISWTDAIADGSYDVILTRCPTVQLADFQKIVPSFPGETVRPKPWTFYANNPLKPKWTRDLVPQLRRFLQEKLPEYMVPSAFVTLEALPLTPNGKVDRRSLSASGLTVELEDIFVAPSTPVEEILTGIWVDVLDLDKVGIHNNFFELGGHSLLATRVISLVRQVFQVELPLRRLFEKPTIAGLAKDIEKATKAGNGLETANIERISRSQELPLSFAQQRLWFLTQLDPKSPSYNMPTAIRLEGQLNLTALQKSFNEILCRHEALRTNFNTVQGRPVAIISPLTALPLSVIDLSELPFVQQDTTVKQLALVEAQQTFDLKSDLLLRVKLLHLSEQEHIVLVTMHHIASDGWSIGVLVREVTALYQAFCSGKPSPLPELPIQYVDFAVWQRQWLQGEVLETQLAYWKQQLGNNLPVMQLSDRPRADIKTHRGGSQSFVISSQDYLALQTLSRKQGVTLFMTLLATFQVLLQRYTNQDDIVVGTDVANRNLAETELLIGFFVNLLVLRTDLSGNPSFRDLLGRVRQISLGAYAHQDLPFEELVKALQPERNLSNTPPLFQVLFVLQNAPMPPLELTGLTLSLLEIEHKVARFDLALFVTETEQGILGKWQYNSDLFDATTITRMTGHFQTLINSIISQPDARIGSLEMLTEAEIKQQATQKKERRAFNQKKLIGIIPQAISLLPERLVKTNYFQPGQTFPLVIQPTTDDIDLIAWAKTNHEFLQTELLKHGAILFRGFNVESVSEFESFAQAISPDLFGDYGDLPRTGEGGKVYGSTPYPSDKAILFHNESSHLNQWPLKIWFFCVQPAQQGGETPIIDCRKAYKIINPKLRERLDRKQLMYVRHYTNGLDVSWQKFFRTDDKSTVENYCRRTKIDFQWYDNNSLITRQIRPALAVHPKTSESVFFNQIQLHHIAYLDAEVRESLLSTFGDKKLPRNVYYGDGTPIEDSVIAEINEVYQQSQTSFTWQKNDILMLDNMLTAHGRNPYIGSRKVVVAMAEMVDK